MTVRRPGWHFLTDHDGNAKRLAEAGRLPLSLRRAHRAVRARRGNHGADAGRQAWRAICTASASVRAISASRSPKRRKARASLRIEKMLLFCYHYDPQGRRYTSVRHEHHARRRHLDGSDHRVFPLADVPLGATERALARLKEGTRIMEWLRKHYCWSPKARSLPSRSTSCTWPCSG